MRFPYARNCLDTVEFLYDQVKELMSQGYPDELTEQAFLCTSSLRSILRKLARLDGGYIA